MFKNSLLLILAVLVPAAACKAELVFADDGKSNYQIVIPNKGADEIVDHWLLMSAKLMQAAFATNGFPVEVVREGEKATDKPGIYLGMTDFAGKSGLRVAQQDDWTYYQKAVGRDLVIVGNDKKDPTKTIRGTKTPLARLGTVKGVCDFLREHVGVRFLFVNMEQSQYATRGGGLDALNEDDSLAIDTRSIAFTPVARIAVPEALDLRKTPMMRANHDSDYETFHYIAMNFFPRLSDVQGAEVRWTTVIPVDPYAKSNPDYFALTPDGRRACDLKLAYAHHLQYCVTHPEVQDLMFREAERLIVNGEKTIYLGTMDSYRLCRCNCGRCNSFFGIKAETTEQYYARGSSGKLWQAFFQITERIRALDPEVRVVVLNYQDTPVSADVIREFPENVIVKVQFADQHDFDKLAGVRIPAGICGFEETFTGFGQAGPYVPERTPEHIAGVVQTMARNHVKWSSRDGSLGYVRGLQAPAYYVYGRMMDDPAADWQTLYKEFCTAAFGDVSSQMTRFFDQLHSQIAVYSDFFGVFMPGWNRKYSRASHRDSKWHVMSMFPPEACAEMHALLSSAERLTKDPDVKARLQLIRIEFDYIRNMARIFQLHSAWLLNRTAAFLNPLVDAIDEWHATLRTLAGGDGRNSFRPLDDWPEMRPFNGHHYNHAALVGSGYQQQWKDTCLNWDTAAIRAGILDGGRSLQAGVVTEAPGIDSDAWARAPEALLRKRGDMPYTNVRTSLKVLRDAENLYVRMECLYPSKHPEDLFPAARDSNAILEEDHVELAIRPTADGKLFRLAAMPAADSCYDAVLTPGPRNRMAEDKAWNGNWEFAYRTNVAKGRWNQAERIWTAWFRIPFADLGGKAPAAGESWGFNAARNRIGQPMLWSDGQGATDPEALGQLQF